MDFLRSFRSKATAFLKLTPGDQWLFFKCWIALLAVDLGLSYLRFTTVVAILQQMSGLSRDIKGYRGGVKQAKKIVELAAGNNLYGMSCLRISYVLFWVLQKRGVPCSLKIGVQKVDGVFRSHAWVDTFDGANCRAGFVEILAINNWAARLDLDPTAKSGNEYRPFSLEAK